MSKVAAAVSPVLPWRRLTFPVDWAEQFGVAPLHLEIGFGDGRYTVRRALEEPEAMFVGLEISSASIQRALAKVRRAGVDNVALLKVGANFAVKNLFAPQSLSSITVNFPDPWPKERHLKNRLLQRSFFELAASRLVPAGTLRLATDHPDYLLFALQEAEASGLFAAHEAEPPAAVFETKYALKWKGQG
ncbi:MAG TPA: tRNA (guanosine(46)-N7)-methyltransferase TrmB, partial [Chloroflexota bacterium]|nr:tRNA (guanosine(46)-N7)-methyltransferase TrmB [Chloroflexota bacterium]